MIKLSIYEHFVAGRDKTELKPIVEKLRKHGVNLILDYCMEADIQTDKQFVNFQLSFKKEKHLLCFVEEKQKQ